MISPSNNQSVKQPQKKKKGKNGKRKREMGPQEWFQFHNFFRDFKVTILPWKWTFLQMLASFLIRVALFILTQKPEPSTFVTPETSTCLLVAKLAVPFVALLQFPSKDTCEILVTCKKYTLLLRHLKQKAQASSLSSNLLLQKWLKY